mmetsp:Transcript_94961/g.307175  ORF Transcript_94961/g.307175 Transcript_94961/m.307175 type:complete len:220 (+) Transcript_94961:148-807(+)
MADEEGGQAHLQLRPPPHSGDVRRIAHAITGPVGREQGRLTATDPLTVAHGPAGGVRLRVGHWPPRFLRPRPRCRLPQAAPCLRRLLRRRRRRGGCAGHGASSPGRHRAPAGPSARRRRLSRRLSRRHRRPARSPRGARRRRVRPARDGGRRRDRGPGPGRRARPPASPAGPPGRRARPAPPHSGKICGRPAARGACAWPRGSGGSAPPPHSSKACCTA